MTPRPASFEPFDSSDPVPGDSYEVSALARRLSDTATEIATQVSNLRKLAEHSTEFWVGKAATKFHDSASDLAGRIEKARGRYEKTGAALAGWATDIDDAQAVAYPAVKDAQAAQAQLDNSKPLPDPPAGSPAPTDADKAKAKQRAQDHADAQSSLDAARRRYEEAVSTYKSKAKNVAGAINDASDHDGLKDSWWDRNFHWIATVMKVIAIIIIVLAIAAIIIACPLSAGLLMALGATAEGLATAATVIEAASAILVGLSLVFDSAAAATGKQSWTAAILDVVSLATLGFGKLAEVGVAGLAKYGSSVSKAVEGGRVGRAVMGANGLPKLTWSLASRSPLFRSAVSVFPKVGRALGEADTAVAASSKELDAVLKGVSRSNVVSMLTQSADVAKDMAKVNAMVDRLPGVLRLGGTKIITGTVVAADAAAQTSVFSVASGFTGYSQYQELRDDKELEKRLDEIVERWSHPLVSVP